MLKDCEQCGQPVPAGSPHGECPACLARAALAYPGKDTDTAAPFALPFGRYELLGELGRGGMGAVFRARDTLKDEIVALKILRAGRFAGPAEQERFAREAEAITALSHPSIVALREVGEHEGQPFFAMNYLAGGNLTEAVRDSTFTPVEAARCVGTIAEAIQHAHERGVIHRDLKPSNVLLDDQGNPHVTDFGLARSLKQDSDITRTGDVLGTPGYMSPEQVGARREAIGPASDVYSLGAILYFLLTGRPPFLAPTFHETVTQTLRAEPVPLRKLNPVVPRDLETVCLKCLQKEPHRRYATARQFAEELDRFRQGNRIRARPIGALVRAQRWCRHRPGISALLAALGMLLIGGILAVLWQWSRAEKSAAAALKANSRLFDVTTRLRMENANRAFRENSPQSGLAILARGVRDNPTNSMMFGRLQSALSDRGLVLPMLRPVRHSSAPESLRFSPDGRRLAVACAGGTVQLWKLAPGLTEGLVLPHVTEVLDHKFAPDGTVLATACKDGSARLWNVSDGSLRQTLKHQGDVNALEFSQDGSWLATASADTTARIWKVSTGTELFTLRGHKSSVLRAAFSPDGKLFATGTEDGEVRVWSLAAEPALEVQANQSNSVVGIMFMSAGSHLVAAWSSRLQLLEIPAGRQIWELPIDQTIEDWEVSPDQHYAALTLANDTARIVDLVAGKVVGTPLVHSRTIYHTHFSPDGTRLATASMDETAAIWDAHTGQRLAGPLPHPWWVFDAQFSPDGRALITGCMDYLVRFWDSQPVRAQPLELMHPYAAQFVNFDPAGRRLLTTSSNLLQVWDAETGARRLGPVRHSGQIRAAGFDSSGSRIITAAAGGSGHVWDAATGREIVPTMAHDGPLATARLSRDGRFLATASEDGFVRVWNTESGRALAPAEKHFKNDPVRIRIYRLAFRPDGRVVSSACHNARVYLWEAATGQLIVPPLETGSPAVAAEFSPDGNYVVVAAMDNTARVWDARTGRPVGNPMRHHETLSFAEFSPNGRLIATASWDQTAAIWDAQSAVRVSGPFVHEGRVDRICFSPDGQSVATYAWDGTARLWDVSTGFPLAENFNPFARIQNVAFSPDGKKIAIAADSGVVSVRPVARDWGAAPEWLAPLAEAVAGERVLDDDRYEPVRTEEFFDMRSRLLSSSETNTWTRWVQWFLADHAARPPNPPQ